MQIRDRQPSAVIEDIEGFGRTERNAVRAALRRALLQDLKARAWPHSRKVPQWRAEMREFLAKAAEGYTPSMQERIDLGAIYRYALSTLPATVDGQPPGPVPPECPFTLDALLSTDGA